MSIHGLKNILFTGSILLLSLLASCSTLGPTTNSGSNLSPSIDNANVEVGFKPRFVPVRVSINQRGEIGLSSSYTFQTPIGVFDISADYRFADTQERYSVPVFIIQVDDEVTVYELEPNVEFDIDFESEQYYKIEQLSVLENGDIILHVTSLNQNNNNSSSKQLSPANIGCAGAPQTRLNIGYTARVTDADGEPNSVRDAPASGTVLGLAPVGTLFEIIDGPVCDNRRVWWKIKTANGYTGWGAEGKPGVYWMEPVN